MLWPCGIKRHAVSRWWEVLRQSHAHLYLALPPVARRRSCSTPDHYPVSPGALTAIVDSASWHARFQITSPSLLLPLWFSWRVPPQTPGSSTASQAAWPSSTTCTQTKSSKRWVVRGAWVHGMRLRVLWVHGMRVRGVRVRVQGVIAERQRNGNGARGASLGGVRFGKYRQ